MRRDLLLLGEMIEAAKQAIDLVADFELDAPHADRPRRDALLWNFTVLGEGGRAARPGDEGSILGCALVAAGPSSKPRNATGPSDGPRPSPDAVPVRGR